MLTAKPALLSEAREVRLRVESLSQTVKETLHTQQAGGGGRRKGLKTLLSASAGSVKVRRVSERKPSCYKAGRGMSAVTLILVGSQPSVLSALQANERMVSK